MLKLRVVDAPVRDLHLPGVESMPLNSVGRQVGSRRLGRSEHADSEGSFRRAASVRAADGTSWSSSAGRSAPSAEICGANRAHAGTSSAPSAQRGTVSSQASAAAHLHDRVG